jgi:AcrR family transcriptional regulator
MARTYRLGRRKQSADETRARIIAAARELLLSKEGFRNFTMEGIARQAGVARMTVYNQFETKTAVYEALADDLAARGKIRDNIAAAFQTGDVPSAIGKLIDAFVHFWLSERDVLGKLAALSQLDPDSHAAERDLWRLEAIRAMMERLQKYLKTRSTRIYERNVDALYILTNLTMCQSLAGAGFSERHIADASRNLRRLA